MQLFIKLIYEQFDTKIVIASEAKQSYTHDSVFMRFHCHRYHWCEIATPFVLLRARNDKIDVMLLVANAPHNTDIVCQIKLDYYSWVSKEVY